MRFMFLFSGGALDGNGLYYDEHNTYSGDHGAQAFADTDGAALGKHFTVINPSHAEHQDGKHSWRRYIYETVSREVLADGKTLIRTRYVGPAP